MTFGTVCPLIGFSGLWVDAPTRSRFLLIAADRTQRDGLDLAHDKERHEFP